MKRKNKLQAFCYGALPVAAALMAVRLAFDAANILPAVYGALVLCGRSIVPSLFPFFVLSGLLTGSGAADWLAARLRSVMRPIFGVDGMGALALVVGLISGYPVGAGVIASLYGSGKINRRDAERLLPFCSNSGPLFIIGAVGTGMLGNARVGLWLYAVHVFCALFVGVCFRRYECRGTVDRCLGCGATSKAQLSGFALLSASVGAAIQSMLTVCGYVVFFAAVTVSLTPVVDSVLPPVAALVVKGVLEVTNGAFLAVQANLPEQGLLVLLSFFIGTGGFCIFMQTAGLLAGSGLSLRSYAVGKLLHGTLAAAATACIYPLISKHSVSTAAVVASSYQNRYGTECLWGLSVCLILVIVMLFCTSLSKNKGTFLKNRSTLPKNR